MAEAVAFLKALEYAEQYGTSRIQLETDSTQLCQAIQTSSRDLSACGNIFKLIREPLRKHFCLS